MGRLIVVILVAVSASGNGREDELTAAGLRDILSASLNKRNLKLQNEPRVGTDGFISKIQSNDKMAWHGRQLSSKAPKVASSKSPKSSKSRRLRAGIAA